MRFKRTKNCASNGRRLNGGQELKIDHLRLQATINRALDQLDAVFHRAAHTSQANPHTTHGASSPGTTRRMNASNSGTVKPVSPCDGL